MTTQSDGSTAPSGTSDKTDGGKPMPLSPPTASTDGGKPMPLDEPTTTS